MPLFEFFCKKCQIAFEDLVDVVAETDTMGTCPKCQGLSKERLISKFAVGGRGDLRESTLHGCHDYTGHSHDSDTKPSGGGCGSGGCGHSH